MKKKSTSIGEILLYLFAAVIAALFLYATVSGANSVSDVLKAGDNAVTLQATISSYEERIDIDEGYESTSYDIFVSYDYDGEHYSYVRYDNSYSKPKLGKTVTVKIDPANPDELLAGSGELGLSSIVSCLFLTGFALLAYWGLRELLLKRAKKQEYDREAAQKKAKAYAYGLTAAVLAAAGWLYYHCVGTWVYMIFMGVAMLLMSLILYIRSRKKTAE